MAEPEVLGLLVSARDEPGVLYNLTEAIFRHGANITYVAGGSSKGNVAEIKLEVRGSPETAKLIKDLMAIAGVSHVTQVPSFQSIYGKRVIVIGGGAQVGMVAQGAVAEADRHNIRGER